MGDFQSKFQEALRRRLFPNASLHLKQIAGAIARSENTVTRWWRGETRVTGDDLYRVAQFFAHRGDIGFLQEVFGDLLPQEDSYIGGEERALDLIRSLLRRMSATDTDGNDRYSWITADGEMTMAPVGHTSFVRRTLNLSASLGDLPAYAMRVLGWIAVTERADNTVVIRHDGRRVAPLAAECICEWLDDHSDQVHHVRRLVHLDQRWVEANHSSAAAAAAIARVAYILRIPRRPWVVRRLALNAITDPLLDELMRIYNQAPDQIVHAAARLGAFTTSNLFGGSGDEVISHYVATGFGFDTSHVIGMNVLARADTDYATMVHARILRTRREGPNYNELVGTIDDRHVRYLNLALPEPGPQGRVLTSTVMLELDRVDA
jgi:transcriptional regulator with XRE-family HTH domain